MFSCKSPGSHENWWSWTPPTWESISRIWQNKKSKVFGSVKRYSLSPLEVVTIIVLWPLNNLAFWVPGIFSLMANSLSKTRPFHPLSPNSDAFQHILILSLPRREIWGFSKASPTSCEGAALWNRVEMSQVRQKAMEWKKRAYPQSPLFFFLSKGPAEQERGIHLFELQGYHDISLK